MKQTFYRELQGHFNLRRPKGKKPTDIFFVIRMNGKQYKLSIGVKVYPSHWNKRKQEAVTDYRLSENDINNNYIVNKKIIETKDNFLKFIDYLCKTNDETQCSIDVLKTFVCKDMTKKKFDIIKYLNTKIDNRQIKESSKKDYYSMVKSFETFINEKKMSITDCKCLTRQMFKDFQKYLQEATGDRGETMANRTINHNVSILYNLLKEAVEDGLLTNSEYQDIKPSKLKETSIENSFALTDEEIMILYNYKCKKQEDEDVKNIFLFECVTGQRVSDIIQTSKNITETDGKLYFSIRQKKTRKTVNVDIIFQMAYDIIAKYHNGFPDYNYNYIKYHLNKVIEESGICQDNVNYEVEEHGKLVSKVVKRCSIIGTHCGRRTFITLLALRGWNALKIKQYTGHSMIDMVERYCKLTPQMINKYETLKKQGKVLLMVNQQDNETTVVKPVDVFNDLFAENIFLQLDKAYKDGVYMYKSDEAKKALSIIKKLSDINKYKDIIDNTYKERYDVLKPIVYNVACANMDEEAYQMFQYKGKQLGFTDEVQDINVIYFLFEEGRENKK